MAGLFSGRFASFAAARHGIASYNDEALVEHLVKAQSGWNWEGKLTPLNQQLFAALLTALTRGRETYPLRVCDFGGGLGGSYQVAQKLLGPDLPLAWDVVEVPNMAAAGNTHFAGNGLRFLDSIEAAAGNAYDVLVASGTLQYIDDPEDALRRLLALQHRHLVVNRFPYLDPVGLHEEDWVLCQDMGLIQSGTYCPHWAFSLNRWQRLFDRDYDRIHYWDDGVDGRHVLEGGTTLAFTGMLLERKGITDNGARRHD